jgi:hypothetical protein
MAVAAGDHTGHGHGLLRRATAGRPYRPFFTMYDRSSTVRQL